MKSRFAVLLLAFAMVAVFASAVWPSSLDGQAGKVKLKRVYTYKKPLAWKGVLRALLDPSNQRLFVAEEADDSPVLRVIDWQQKKEVAQLDFSSLACNGPWDAVPRIKRMDFVPQTRFLHLWYCGADYLFDSDSLQLKHRLTERSDQPEAIDWARSGEYALVTRWEPRSEQLAVALYRVAEWKRIATWDLQGRWARFTANGKFFMVARERAEPGPGVRIRRRVACGLSFHEVPDGNLTHEWEVGEQKISYPREYRCLPFAWEVFPLRDHYQTVELHWRDAVVVRDAWTGRVMRILKTDVAQVDGPHVSPDERLAVVGAWETWEDYRWSRDYIIWDLKKGEIAHQTRKYLSPLITAKEVHARFSTDGGYLVVAKNREVELHRVTRPTEKKELQANSAETTSH
jgi:hypothetical protein